MESQSGDNKRHGEGRMILSVL